MGSQTYNPGQWQTRERHLQCEILISGDWIEAHAENNGKQEWQRVSAQVAIPDKQLGGENTKGRDMHPPGLPEAAAAGIVI